MRKVDPKNKICIYLDQFVVSDLIDESSELWKEIKILLEALHRDNIIYCPLSVQHFFETSKKELEAARLHHEYFLKLSDKYFFKNELFLTTQLISSLIRKNKHTVKTFLEIPEFKDFDEIYAKTNKINAVFDESLDYKLSSQNDLRKILNPKITQKQEPLFLNAIKSLEIQNFKERLEDYIIQKKIYIRPDNYGRHDFPNWIDQLLYILTNTHAFKEIHFRQLLDELKKYGFDRIPTLDIRFSIGAFLTIKNKQENAGDHMDIMRIANSLCSSDILFTDKKRKHEIQSLGLDSKYNTRVFSGVEKDLEEFKSSLLQIA
jgi:hypothetical protein